MMRAAGAGVTAVRWRDSSGRELLVAGGVLAAGCALLLDSATVAHGPVVCPLRLMTGVACPGCGSVRAWTAALDGDVALAVSYNPFAVGLLAAVLVAAVWMLMARVPRARPLQAVVAIAVPAQATRMGAVMIAAAWLTWAAARAAGLVGAPIAG
jgi:hypothetical protein